MSTASLPERFCSSCERRCGAEIDACAGAGRGCVFVPIASPAVSAVPPAERQMPNIVQLFLLLVLIFAGIPALFASVFWLANFGVWISLLPMVGLVALIVWWIRRRKRDIHVVGDAQSGAFLTVTTWPRARRPALYLWHAPAEPVALDVPPLLVPESASTVVPTALLRDYRSPDLATGEEAVKIGQLLLLDLVARGEVIVRRRQAFYARGPADFTPWVAIYELTLPTNPTGANLSDLDQRLLRPFASAPANTPLSAEAVIGGLYNGRVHNPTAHLVAQVRRPRGHYSAETLQLMRTTLNQRLAAVAAQHPQLLTTWAVEIGRAIAAHQEASDGGGGGDGGGG